MSRRLDTGTPRLRGGVRLAVILLARLAIGTAVVSSLWTVAPLAFGWTSTIVVSGSMMPRIHPGDIVVSQPIDAAEVRPGQPVLVENPAKPGHLLLHRVVRRTADGSLVTKGDANDAEDSAPVPASSVRALPRLLVRYVGLPLYWRSIGAYQPLLLTAVAFAVLLAIAVQYDAPRSRPTRPGRRDGTPRHRRGSNRRRRQTYRRRLRRPMPVGPAPVLRGATAAVAAAAVLSIGPAQATSHSAKATGTNSWQSGTVTFGPNSPAGALFAINTAIAGSYGTACVKVTYTGSLPAQARLYVSSTTGGGLETYLGVQVRSGTGTASNCSDFSAGSTDYNAVGLTDATKTLATLQAASHDYAGGVGSWTVTTGSTRTYQVSWLMLPDNNATSRTVTFGLTWEAQG